MKTSAKCFVCVLLAAACWAAAVWADPATTRPQEGLRDRTPAVYALTGAKLVVAPGQTLSEGVIIIRDGVIADVGESIELPPEARRVDLSGKTVYPGLIDAYSEAPAKLQAGGTPYWNDQVTPQRNVAEGYQPDEAALKKLRQQGITAQLIAPSGGVIKGTSALVLTGTQPPAEAVVRPQVGQHMRLTVSRNRSRNEYPNSPMGAVALARQAMLDADWYQRAWSAHRVDPQIARPEQNAALEVLQRYPSAAEPVVIDASNELFFLRADRFAREFGLRLVVRGSGHEYRRLDAIVSTRRPVLLPVNFPKPPNVGSAEAALRVELEDLMHWDHAPENPARLAAAGVPIALTSYGLDDRGHFLKQVRTAVRRGLSAEDALRALTVTPAELFAADKVLGTIARGKLANLVVTDGDLFADKTKVLETWIRGQRYEHQKDALPVAGTWRVVLEGETPPRNEWYVKLTGTQKLAGEVFLKSPAGDVKADTKLTHAALGDARFSATFNAKPWDMEGVVRLTAVVFLPDEGAARWVGQVVWPDGRRTPLTAERTRLPDAEDKDSDPSDSDTTKESDSSPPEADDETKADEKSDEAGAAAKEKPTEEEDKEQEDSKAPQPASFAVQYPLGAFGRQQLPPRSEYVVLRNATLWTCGPQGKLEKASLLIHRGVIAAVGTEIETPQGAEVIDLQGKHVTPGIIDCHSHMATDGGINESTQSITAEVRIGDFIDADDINIYRQLAGGVTVANILHGSANTIGGQNQVIKLRWGMLPEEMKFAEAPPGIKFALGENVKQSNWGDEFTTRYPQTRMGVEQLVRDALLAARAYQARWARWEQEHEGLPPRRDLELEALAEVQAGTRWIHCHSYRQDEILALLRTLDEFGITIGTFQHILEGYKVADEMAKHGAMGSAFSDWWAYKFEVYDAIPYAGALMHGAGVVVSFNSDDQELARHLNHEAAKAQKYGQIPAEEALKFVTLNPARQLRIDQYVGSLEVGKQADLVVWSGEPLSIASRCEQTWIDGRRYFDVSEDQQLRKEAEHRHTVLVQKILGSGETMKGEDESSKSDDELWPRCDVFCHRHGDCCRP